MKQQRKAIYRALEKRLEHPPDGMTYNAEQSPDLDGLSEIVDGLCEIWRQPVPAPPTGLRPGRSHFLTRAASRSSRRWLHAPLSDSVRAFARIALTVGAIFAALVPLTHGIVRAAQESTPGHPLYALKARVEQVQYAGAEQPDVRVALSLAFLGERVAEAQTLVYEQDKVGADFPVEVQLLTSQLLRAIAETPDTTLPDILSYAQLQLQAYLKVLVTVEPLADEGSAQNLSGMTQACRRAYLVVTRALTYPEQFQNAYRSGRPELFLLPGETPLGGEAVAMDQVPSTQGTPQ